MRTSGTLFCILPKYKIQDPRDLEIHKFQQGRFQELSFKAPAGSKFLVSCVLRVKEQKEADKPIIRPTTDDDGGTGRRWRGRTDI